MKKILWLASWYPSKVDAYTGDFIERHARAAALVNYIKVIHVIRDKYHLFREKQVEEHRQYPEGAEATIIYYHTPVWRIDWVEKIYSNYIYLKLHKNYLKKYIRENGKPNGIHVHIGLKAGMAALFIKYRYRIPYVVSEQWSGLCQEARPNFTEKPFFFRLLWRWVMKNATGCSAVSAYLAASMEQGFSIKNVTVIPNVVDSSVFYPSGINGKNTQFIHISTLKYQKNAEQLLEAAAMLKKQLPDFKLLIFGEPTEALLKFADVLNLKNVVEFKGLCEQNILRKYIQESIALILYSRFETFGCVVIEANACGKPVIVSDIPVFHENVQKGITGFFVPLNNPGLLAESMYVLAMNPNSLDPHTIEKYARENYSFEKGGTQFNNFYNDHFS